MAATIDIPAGGYRYIPLCLPVLGRRARRCEGYPDRAGGIRPDPCRSPRALRGSSTTWASRVCRCMAFCACELRSPAQFTDTGFIDFNRHYTATLNAMGRDEERRGQSGGAQQRHPGAAQAGRAEFLRVLLCPPGCRRRRDRSLSPAAARPATVRTVSGAHRPLWRDKRRCDAREGACSCSARMEERMAALGKSWARHNCDPGLHGARSAFLSGRRDRPARCGPARPDLALCASAGRGTGIRGGLPSVPVEHHVRA